METNWKNWKYGNLENWKYGKFGNVKDDNRNKKRRIVGGEGGAVKTRKGNGEYYFSELFILLGWQISSLGLSYCRYSTLSKTEPTYLPTQ